MAYITQTTSLAGSLTGLSVYQLYGQAVFNIGWNYIFVSSNPNQMTGNLINCNPATGAPTSIYSTGISIVSGSPYANSWNTGYCICPTVVDNTPYLYMFFDDNPTVVYRGVWDDTNKYYKNITSFVTGFSSVGGANYNLMVRMNDTTIRLITDARNWIEFNVRTGAVTRATATASGTWSPSSYPYVNAFTSINSPNIMYGASGDGNNWYYHDSVANTASSFDPSVSTVYMSGIGSITTTPYAIFPSTHFNVSYYVPNNGYIYAYTNSGVYIQQNPLVTVNSVSNLGIYSITLSTSTVAGATAQEVWFEWGTTTNFGSSYQVTVSSAASTTYTYDLPGLSPGMSYYYRAYTMPGGTKAVSPTYSFTTKTGLATVTTGSITGIATTSATAAGTVTAFNE